MTRFAWLIAILIVVFLASAPGARAELPWIAKVDPPWAGDPTEPLGDPDSPYGTPEHPYRPEEGSAVLPASHAPARSWVIHAAGLPPVIWLLLGW
jgi:hypothetical protein